MTSVKAPPTQLPHLDLTRVEKLNSLLEVAKAMTAARNLDTLLPLILREAARVVQADRCSLFILDRERGELWSRIAQGTSQEIRVGLGSGIAGSVASTGQIINLNDAYLDERFNRSFDVANAYRTKSVLCVPMRDTRGDITGVIQALNAADGAFDAEDEELLLALGGQAAQAIENALLNDEIDRLFEGFVSASVLAIEARDPTTAGHSSRVAALTVALAKATEASPPSKYSDLRFTAEQLQELRYASLLHDFGKVGVREHVLVKAAKLHPSELDLMRARFDLARKDRQLASYQRLVDAVRMYGDEAFERFEHEERERLERELKELDEGLAFVEVCNQPTVLPREGFERLTAISEVTFNNSRDQPQTLLSPGEVQVLSIPQGSLSATERKEIESHVTHTYRFLSQIPWTKTLRRVPEIAYAHHEKLDGKGYPRSVSEIQIPVQSKMMSIADIYDALTASDRPYKKAMPKGKALDILHAEAKAHHLDADLFRVFIEAGIPDKALGAGGTVHP